MRLIAKLSTAVLLVGMLAPVASAKVFPDDFLPSDMMETLQMQHSSTPSSMPMEGGQETMMPYMPSRVPEGGITRKDFVVALASRLYDTQSISNCYAALAPTLQVDYTLLFRDVSIDESYAPYVCMAMRMGLVRGFPDGSFRPDKPINAAEAAAIYSRLGLTIRQVKGKEAWYVRYMEAMRSIDSEFTLRPWETLQGAELTHQLCKLTNRVPALDPMGEFAGGC